MRGSGDFRRRPTLLARAGLAAAASMLFAVGFRGGLAATDRDPLPQQEALAEPQTLKLRGHVVWLAEALEARFGIKTDPDVAHSIVALAAEDGQLLPIVKDARGRAFHLDDRLRDMPLQLVLRKYEGSPVVQVVRMFHVKDDGLYELDYFCDVCAIPMFELKPCECCQGETRLRERRSADVPAQQDSP